MVRYSDRHPSSQYISIFSSELEFMAGLANEWGEIETGGELYGLQTHAGRLVIMYATPPGPKAVHAVAHFQQNIGYFRKTNSLLLDLGLQYNGNWHNHHRFSIKGPSSQDIRSLHSLASRNEYRRLCQFVLTFESDPTANSIYHSDHRFQRMSSSVCAKYTPHDSFLKVNNCARIEKDSRSFVQSPTFIAVHSFFYSDARIAGPMRCPIKVLAGKSPIRIALEQGDSILARIQVSAFPINRIHFDSVGQMPYHPVPVPELPTRLHRQFTRLPLTVQDGATLRYGDGLIVFFLPTEHGNGQIISAHSGEPPHPVLAAYYSEDSHWSNSIKITKAAAFHGEFTKLSTLYKRAIRSLGISR